MVFAIDNGAFVGFVVEGVLFGIYIPIFALFLGAQFYSRKDGSQNNLITTVTCCTLFALSTCHFSLNFHHAYHTLILKDTSTPHLGVETLDSEISNVLFTFEDFLAQLVLIYRCWRIWERSYPIIVLPLIFSIVSIAFGIAGTSTLLSLPPTATTPTVVIYLGTTSFVTSLIVNLMVTSLILLRIRTIINGVMQYQPSLARHQQRHPRFIVLEAFVESGVLYVIVQLVFVLTFVTRSPAKDVALSAAAQIYGIAPTLIIVRVILSKTFDSLHDSDFKLSTTARNAAGNLQISSGTLQFNNDSAAYELSGKTPRTWNSETTRE